MPDQFFSPPEWVSKRDGRLVPFEADKISRALFAASESLGRPDSFTARELTDGVLHFLGAEPDESTRTTAQIAELVEKVVRELGQPALAQAFAEGRSVKKRSVGLQTPEAKVAGPLDPAVLLHCPSSLPLVRAAGAASLSEFSLRAVFARDLAAAHADRLLTLGGLEAPLELAGCLLKPSRHWQLVEDIEEARGMVGELLAIDGPEYDLSFMPSPPSVLGYLRELGIAVRSTGLRVVVNLNVAVPPIWEEDLAEGPLFPQHRRELQPEILANLLEEMLDRLLLSSSMQGRVRLDWHLGERDFAPAAGAHSPASHTGPDHLVRLSRRAAEGIPLAFVFDRPRRPISLAEGIDRQHPATLMTVYLHLPRLVEQINRQSPGGKTTCAPEVFLQKLGSLARLALSAAVQKRDFLRRHNRAWPAFLLERARLSAVPVGLESSVRALTGQEPGVTGPGLEFAGEVVRRLADVLLRDGQAVRLDTCLNSLASHGPLFKGIGAASEMEPARSELPPLSGLVPWKSSIADLKNRLKAAGMLITSPSSTGMGSVSLLMPEDQRPTSEEVLELLRWIWQHTDLVRIRFLRVVGIGQKMMTRLYDEA